MTATLEAPPETDKAVRNVLLVEDSSVTKDLVELVLTQNGHTVTSVETGEAAVEALLSQTFDVVLTDFHLPDFNGIEVVKRFDAQRGASPRPLFIAITGDTRGLLADKLNCELFDKVVPKPLDIDVVSELVTLPPVKKQPQNAAPMAQIEQAGGLGLALLEWPLGRGPSPAPGLPGLDAILVRERRDIEALWRLSGANLLPVLDATGKLGASADFDLSDIKLSDREQLRLLVEGFHERRSELHPDFLRADDPADRLIARIAVAGGRLSARLSHFHDTLYAWNTLCDPGQIATLLHRLKNDALVATSFFDRVHHCPSCQSGRVIVREECPSCGSPQISEESYVHHFRCATQAPESDFAQGDDLVCPKCRRELHHFGRDYDRPGNLTRCGACGESNLDPEVAFVCARCETRTVAEAMPYHDIENAELTDTGRAYLRSGRQFLGSGRSALRFGDFPLELVVALNKAAARYNEDSSPFALVSISYEGMEQVRETAGLLRAQDARRLWLEALQQNAHDQLIVARGGQGDFALLPGTAPEAAERALALPIEQAAKVVRDDLQPKLQFFGPEDLSR